MCHQSNLRCLDRGLLRNLHTLPELVKMSFSNQFALTKELTRLLPPVGWAASKAADALISHVRDLRQSGSDIVVEDDLVKVFGRCRVSSTLASSFKTLVTQSTSNVPLVDGILLQGGPGPTVIRAFKEKPYFAMVVQLSFLVWAFDASYLATAIADGLRKRVEVSSSTSEWSSTPDRESILGVLRACESQTSAYNWSMNLEAVSTTLGYEIAKVAADLPACILHGLLDMLPMVQTFPDDRFIHIQITVNKRRGYFTSGIPALVVWAHHILDLTVLVLSRGTTGEVRKTRFGNSLIEQVIIEEVHLSTDKHGALSVSDLEAAITLLDSQREHLLTIKTDPDSEQGLIGSLRRRPARGWGRVFIKERLCGTSSSEVFRTENSAVVEDIQNVIVSFAFIIVQHLVKDDFEKESTEQVSEKRAAH